MGLPLRLDGSHGEMAEEASRFAERVRKQIGVPVEMVDERLTSWEAERLLEEQGGRVLKAAHARGKRQRCGKAAAQAKNGREIDGRCAGRGGDVERVSGTVALGPVRHLNNWDNWGKLDGSGRRCRSAWEKSYFYYCCLPRLGPRGCGSALKSPIAAFPRKEFLWKCRTELLAAAWRGC